MDYFNVVDPLRQAGIPPLAEERRDTRRWDGSYWPLLLIAGGGPGVTMNPNQWRRFSTRSDRGRRAGGSRDSSTCAARGCNEDRDGAAGGTGRLPAVAKPPSGHRIAITRTSGAWSGQVRELAEYDATSTLYTPDTEFADMHLMEIARGCGRVAASVWPGMSTGWHGAAVERLLASAERACRTGYRRAGLVSAAVSDHTQIDGSATQLQAMGVAISASSMRMDPISVPLIRRWRRAAHRRSLWRRRVAASVCAM